MLVQRRVEMYFINCSLFQSSSCIEVLKLSVGNKCAAETATPVKS